MKNSLIIVESPTKARIIKKFLGNKYDVISSMGHIRDLPPHKFGIDIEKKFEPEYEIIKGKKKILESIKKALKNTDKVYLAMDEDREGEAIGWHLMKSLNIKDSDRIVFHEITEEAIRESLESPRKIDENLVNAQQARRVLDRIVGYKISPLLSKKIRRGLSAGRVQSVGLKIIVDREKERNKFKPQTYYTIEGIVDINGVEVKSLLWGSKGKKFGKLEIDSSEMATKILKNCKDEKIVVSDIIEKEKKSFPPPPFITSSLQQEAFNKLRLTPGTTMRIAQQLYEGLDLKSGSSGLITYMRTDSVKIAASAIDKTRGFIAAELGNKYLPKKPNTYRSKKTAQEAHECIRPTDILRLPDSVKDNLTKEQFELYKLIWKRFVACQVKPAVIKNVTVNTDCGDYNFRITGQTLLFDGYMKVLETGITENELPAIAKGEIFKWKVLVSVQHETKPLPRFTTATLVKELEKNGIGRPSTYAAIINTLFKRKYVVSVHGALVPEEIGIIVSDVMEKHFEQIVDKKFTSRMENSFDDIASGKQDWKKMLGEFYNDFIKLYEDAFENMEKIKDEESDVVCPQCDAAMVIRRGRNGKFLACSSFPKCKKTFNIDENGESIKEETTKMKCPKCSSSMIIKTGRYGKFLACSEYPKCKTTLSADEKGDIVHIPLGYERCPKCGKETVIKAGFRGKFLACTGYPKCRFSKNITKKNTSADKND